MSSKTSGKVCETTLNQRQYPTDTTITAGDIMINDIDRGTFVWKK